MFKNLNCGAIGQKASFEEAVALAREFGFGGVDIDLGYAKEKGASAVKDLLAKNNLKAGGIGFSCAFREKDSDTAWADSLVKVANDAKLAAEIGVTRAATWVPPASDSVPFRQALQLFVARIKPAAEIMGAYGISVGLEFIGPRTLRQGKKYGFLYTMDGMRAACTAIGPNCGLLLDCWHWYTCQSTVTDLEQLEKGDVVYVHLNDAPSGIAVNDQVDNKRELPAATGVIDIKGFLGALKKIGYDGPLTVEPFNEPLKKMNVKDAVKATSESLTKAFKIAGV